MGFDDDERAEGDEFSQELEEFVSRSAKTGAKHVAKKAGKAAAKAGAKAVKAGAKAVANGIKAVGSAVAKVFVATLPWSAVVLGVIVAIGFILLVIENYFGGLRDIFRAFDEKDTVFDKAASSAWADFSDAKYEDELEDWLNGDIDQDATALFAQTVINNEDAGEKIWEEDPTHTAGQDTYIQDMMRNEHMLLAQDDMIDIMKMSFNYNKRMFQYEDHWYEWLKWGFQAIVEGAEIKGFKWVRNYPVSLTTENQPKSDDLFKDNLSRMHIEGEEDGAGNRIFEVHWQDVMALANFFSYCNYDNWGNTGEASEYDPVAAGLDINGTNGYYMSDDDINRIFDLFKYDFKYYWDGVNDHGHADEYSKWLYNDLSDSANPPNLAYRYKRIADPDEGVTVEDPSHHAGELPFTRFVPESAPDTISNSWETYKYVYISTNEVPNYTPDPGVYTPPDGFYCIGRWKIVDSRYFIETLSELCPWYEDRTFGEEGQKFVHQTHYNWVDDMIQTYVEMREYLPNTASRSMLFEELADMFNKKVIKVSYKGVRYDGMDEFVKKLQDLRPGWTVEFDDSEVKDFSEYPHGDEDRRPFWSYGVTYNRNINNELGDWTGDRDITIDPELLDGIDDDLLKKIIEEALSHVGEPYVWGATGPHSFDCSGLMKYSFGKYGVSLPRTARDQFAATSPIAAGAAKPGDLVFFRNTGGRTGITHVGLYLGDGKFVEAKGRDYGIVISRLDTGKKSFAGFHRVTLPPH